MTRKIDRVHEARARDRRPFGDLASQRPQWRPPDPLIVHPGAANELRELLGIAPGLSIDFGGAKTWDGQAGPPSGPSDEVGDGAQD